MEIRASTFDELHRRAVAELVERPDCVCRPRGMLVRECLGVQLVLTDPRARVLESPARAANYGFAVGEFLWYLRGADDLESIAYYNKRMRAYSDDGTTMASAYGKRLRRDRGLVVGNRQPPRTQWQMVVDELVRDRDSRRAVMAIYSASDLARAAAGAVDVPCTVALQFLVRRGARDLTSDPPRLHMSVTMRSNDVIWGLANDLFSFTLLQETMLLDLRATGEFSDLELGAYRHHAASLHLYERHFGTADTVLRESPAPARMPPVDRRADLDVLLEDEQFLRRPTDCGSWTRRRAELAGGAAWMRDRLLEHRARRDAGAT